MRAHIYSHTRVVTFWLKCVFGISPLAPKWLPQPEGHGAQVRPPLSWLLAGWPARPSQPFTTALLMDEVARPPSRVRHFKPSAAAPSQRRSISLGSDVGGRITRSPLWVAWPIAGWAALPSCGIAPQSRPRCRRHCGGGRGGAPPSCR